MVHVFYFLSSNFLQTAYLITSVWVFFLEDLALFDNEEDWGAMAE